MTPNNKKQLRITLLRLACAATVLFAALAAHLFSLHNVRETAYLRLTLLAEGSTRVMTDWLNFKEQFIMQLATDPRVLQVIQDPVDSANLARRALYEFGYINKLKSIYLFTKDQPHPILTTAGAPELSLSAKQAIARAQRNKKESFSHVFTIDGVEYFFSMNTILDDTAESAGYIAYLQPLRASMKGLQSSLSRMLGTHQFSIYRHDEGERVLAIENVTQSIPFIRPLTPEVSNMPVFTPEPSYGKYTDFLRNEVLAAVHAPRSRPEWRVSVADKAEKIFEEQSLMRQIIWMIAVLLALAAQAIPVGGKTIVGALIPIIKSLIPEKKEKPDVKLKDELSVEERTRREVLKRKAEKARKRGEELEGDVDIGSIVDDVVRDILTEDEKQRKEARTEETDVSESGEYTPASQSGDEPLDNFVSDIEKPSVIEEQQQRRLEDIPPSDSEIVYAIRSSISHRRMKLLYQPIVDAVTEEVSMYEILLRLHDDKGKELPPSQIFPVADKHNLSAEIDAGVINTVVDRHLARAGQNVVVSVNLTGKSFDSINFLQALVHNISQRGMPTGLLIFEIQSLEIMKHEKGMEFIKSVRQLGCRFAVDYFGGGPAMIEAAAKMHFDFIKVNGLNFDPTNASDDKIMELIQISQAANKLEIPLVMEKIETEALKQTCKKLGITYLQGYHIGKPQDGLF